MINANMREYDYYTYGTTNEYGQRQQTAEKQGTIKMAISITSQSIQDNVLYKNAEYMGLTHDTKVNDTYVIEYGKERLKVLYIAPQTAKNGFTRVFMARMV